MKKSIIIGLTACLFSCQSTEDTPLQTETKEYLSKIEELEASGVKLYKKELKLYDITKKNSIKLTLASENEAFLSDYINNTDKILKVYKSSSELLSSSSQPQGTKTDTGHLPEEPEFMLYEVVTAKDLEPNVKAYGVSYVAKSVQNKNGARLAEFGHPYGTWHESNRFDDWMRVEWNYTGNTNEGVTSQFLWRDCALCGWQTESFTVSLNSTATTGLPEYYVYGSRDARRLALRVWHSYYNYNWTSGNF